MLPSLPTPALDLIWDYLDDEASRKSLLKASKATRHAFGGVISRCTFIISSSERESRANAAMRRLPAISLQCLKLKPLKQKAKDKKKPVQAGPEMDRSFDTSLAAFFESGASQRGKLPWSGIKFLRLEGFELSMHSTPFIGLAAPQLSHVHLSHTKLDGMCVSGLLSCTGLSHLTFSHVIWLTRKMAERALSVIPLLPHLRHLTFIEVQLPLIEERSPLPYLHIPRLESLHIIGCSLPEDIGWRGLLASVGHSCTNLTSLVIHPRLRPSSASPLLKEWLQDSHFTALGKGCPCLRYLDFGPFATVSDTGVAAMIRNMPKLQHVVAQDLRPPPHRSRQEAAAIAGEWVVAVEERRKRQQYRNKRKRERGSLGQVRAGAGQAGPLSTAQAGGESAGASAGVPAGREGGGQAALSIATEGNGPWGGDQAGARDQAPPTVGQGPSTATAAAAAAASAAAAAAAAGSAWEAQVEAAEAAIQAHLYPVHDPVHGWRAHGEAPPSAEPTATLPWTRLTLFAPSVESIAALPLGPQTKVCLGGLIIRPGTQPAVVAQAALQLARCGSFYSTASTPQETADAIINREDKGVDHSTGNRRGKLLLIFLPSWSTLIEAPPRTLPEAGGLGTPATAAEAGAAPADAALGLMDWFVAPEPMGKPEGGMGPVGGDASMPGSSYFAMEKVNDAISALREDLMATPASSTNTECARALLELSRLRQRLHGMLEKASVVECVYASTLACVAAADTVEVTSTTIPRALGLLPGAELPKSLKDALNAVIPPVRVLRCIQPHALVDLPCSHFEAWRMCFCARAMTNTALLRLQHLPVLTLSNGLKLEKASGVLGSLAPLRGKLHSLDIRGAHISEACMAAFEMALRHTTPAQSPDEVIGSLRALALNNCTLEPQAWHACAKVLPQLSELTLTIGKGITLRDASEFVKSYMAISLERLNQQQLQQQQQQSQAPQQQQGGAPQQQAQRCPRQRHPPPTSDLSSEARISGAAAGSAGGGNPGPNSTATSSQGGTTSSSRVWKRSLHKVAPAGTDTTGAAQAGPVSTVAQSGPVSSATQAGPVSSATQAGLVSTVPQAGPVSSATQAGPVSSVPQTGQVSSEAQAGPVSSVLQAGPVSSAAQAVPVSSVPQAGPVSSATQAGPVSSTTQARPVTTAAVPAGVPVRARPLLLRVHGLKASQVDDLRSLVDQQAHSKLGPLVVLKPGEDL